MFGARQTKAGEGGGGREEVGGSLPFSLKRGAVKCLTGESAGLSWRDDTRRSADIFLPHQPHHLLNLFAFFSLLNFVFPPAALARTLFGSLSTNICEDHPVGIEVVLNLTATGSNSAWGRRGSGLRPPGRSSERPGMHGAVWVGGGETGSTITN